MSKVSRDVFDANELVKVGDGYKWQRLPVEGDKVQLNSGGPTWTVDEVDGEFVYLAESKDFTPWPWKLFKLVSVVQ
jgi:hypothetical protein